MSKTSTRALAERVREFAWRLNRRASAASAGVGPFTASQELIAVRIFQRPGLTGAELARLLLLTPQSINATVATLIESGWVTVERSETDGRRRELHLTAAGCQAVEQIRSARSAWLSELLDERLSASQRADVKRALDHLDQIF